MRTQLPPPAHRRLSPLTRFAMLAIFLTPAWGEQTYVTRYDLFGGYSYFNSPKVSLAEHGFHIQVGVRPSKWYSIGFDYSNVRGDLTITPDLLPTNLQNQIRTQLGGLAAAGLLPPNYMLSVRAHSFTQTFTVGPQVAFRKWVPITLFVRPSCGFIREAATPAPADAIARGVVAQLAPGGKLTDWTPFYGGGGGVDLNFGPHFALRIQADYVWDHLFSSILRDGRNTVRFSIGPAINFGHNIIRP